MIDFLYSIDKQIFHFVNQDLANSLFDMIMPYLTDYDKYLIGRVVVGILYIYLLWKGGKKGRIIALLLIPLIAFSDQLSSSVIKKFVMRPRPCHEINGIIVADYIRSVAYPCGSGFSFPSSHAVNNFAVATFFSFYYRRWWWAFICFATVIAFSRVYLGVHFPADVIGGAIIGVACAYFIIWLWQLVSKRFPALEIPKEPAEISTATTSDKE